MSKTTTLSTAPRTAPAVIDLGRVLGKAKAQPVSAIHALAALGNSIRRSAAVVTELGAKLPEVNEESDRHFYSAEGPAGTIARCGADLSERVTRHGHEVTCQMCRDIRRAEREAADADEPAGELVTS